MPGSRLGCSSGRAASFDEQGVAPATVVLSDSFAGSDGAEASGGVQGSAGAVLGEDRGLDRPDAGRFADVDEPVEQQPPEVLATGIGVDVDGVLDDAGVAGAGGDGAGGDPAEHGVQVVDGDVAVRG